jgi:SPASM domain peptide maturase of grasp-with-spasm system
MKTDKVLKRFSNCIPVKGYSRSAIYDLQRVKLDPIPNALQEILAEQQFCTKEEVLANYTKEDQPTILEYLDFLDEKEYIFYCNPADIPSFPELQKKWDFPAIISNAVIEDAALLNLDIVQQLSALGVNTLVIIYPSSSIDIKKTAHDLRLFNDTFIDNLIIVLNSLHQPLFNELIDLFEQEARVSEVRLYNQRKEEKQGKLRVIPQPFSWKNDPIRLIPSNIPTYTEAQDHHLFFNRKLFIGEKGEIKNSFDSSETYGHINNTRLQEAIETPGFKRLWKISKDQTDVCKDCEFRYCCLDKRIPLQRTDGSWFHAIPCDYNPYIAKWKEEQGYATLKESGVIINMAGSIIDHDKIQQLERKIWEEA